MWGWARKGRRRTASASSSFPPQAVLCLKAEKLVQAAGSEATSCRLRGGGEWGESGSSVGSGLSAASPFGTCVKPGVSRGPISRPRMDVLLKEQKPLLQEAFRAGRAVAGLRGAGGSG